MITRRKGFPQTALVYDPALPPPLCFTVPAGYRRATGQLATPGRLTVSLATPRLMADLSDPTTWQRPYRFT